jgi:hypothetical protein
LAVRPSSPWPQPRRSPRSGFVVRGAVRSRERRRLLGRQARDGG